MNRERIRKNCGENLVKIEPFVDVEWRAKTAKSGGRMDAISRSFLTPLNSLAIECFDCMVEIFIQIGISMRIIH